MVLLNQGRMGWLRGIEEVQGSKFVWVRDLRASFV